MSDYGYGLWFRVILNSLLFIVFAVSLFRPQTRDWRRLLGVRRRPLHRVYGYPATVYLLSGPLVGLVPGVDL